MNKKRLYSLFLAAIMAVVSLSATSASAMTTGEPAEYKIQVNDDLSVIANVPAEYQALISKQDLIDIALDENLQDGERINIEYVGSAVERSGNSSLSPFFLINTYPTTLTKSGSEYAGNTFQVTSAAKGETVTLEREYSQTVTASISGDPYSITAELQGSVTATYSITKEFVGPPETSRYNSREYRVRFYIQKYNFYQEHYASGYFMGSTTGTVNKPTRWASYSIDSIQ